MNKLIFILCLLTGNAFGQGLYRGPWTTNIPPARITVNDTTGGGITNIGANGTHYGFWTFYGNTSNTVARLADASNVVNSATGALSGTFILKYNGSGTNTVFTSPTIATGGFTPGSDAAGLTNLAYSGGGTVGDIPVLGGGSAETVKDFGYDSGAFTYDVGAEQLKTVNQTNSGTLDVAGAVTLYQGLRVAVGPNANIFDFDPTTGVLDIGSGEARLSPGKLVLDLAGPPGIIINDNGGNGETVNIEGSSGTITALGRLRMGGSAAFGGNITNSVLSPSKIVSTGSGTQLVSSVYSDIDFTRILSGGSTNQGLTNAYVSGLFFPGLNTNTFITTTGQTASAVGMTYWSRTNGSGYVPVITINNTNGNVGIGTNDPKQALDVIGTAWVHGPFTNVGGASVGGVSLVSGQVTINAAATSDTLTFASGSGPSLSSVTSTEVNFAGNGFSAMTAFSLGKRDSNTCSLVMGNTPPVGFWRDGTKITNITWGVGRLVVTNNYIPYTNLDLADIYLPFSSTLAFSVGSGGSVTSTYPFISKSSISAPTNTAPITTVASANLHTIAINSWWTNDLASRADMVISVKYVDAATGDPALGFTNTITGEAWTNTVAFGLTGTYQELLVIPDISPNDYGVFTNLSGTGSSVTFLSAKWKLK